MSLPNLQYGNDEGRAGLSDIPADDVIYRQIFPRLDVKTLFRLAATCRDYRHMVHEFFEQITVVNVFNEGNKISEAALETLMTRMRCCKKLILKNCKSSLTDKFLMPALERNQKIYHMDLSSCTSLSNHSMQTLATSCSSTLRHLSLRDCVWASPEAVTNIGIHCNMLEFLDVSGCWHVNDETIATISITCPRLQELNISRVYCITDKSLVALAKNTSKIRQLNIRDCWRVTDESLWMLMEYAKNLKAVQIKGCRSITFRLVDSLKRKGILVDVLSLQSQLNNSSPPVQI